MLPLLIDIEEITEPGSIFVHQIFFSFRGGKSLYIKGLLRNTHPVVQDKRNL